jgi:hypothetical protein
MLKYTIDIYKDESTNLWSATIDEPTDVFGVDRGLITKTVFQLKDFELSKLNDELTQWLGTNP